jgi:hypothetical protein
VQYNNRDLRLMLPNFYYDQEDFFRERQQGKALALDRAAPGSGNRLWSQQSDESYDVDCGLCRHLKRTPVSLRFPGTKKGYWDFKSNHVGRHSQPVRGGQGDFQHQWRLFPSEIPSAAHCRDVRHGDGRSYTDASYRVYGR